MLKKFFHKITSLLGSKVDAQTLENLEQLFFEADLGAEVTSQLMRDVETLYKKNPEISAKEVIQKISQTLLEQYKTPPPLTLAFSATPHVIMVVGVNGNGKTTSVAKLAHYYMSRGKKVLIAAADTFRAAATEQLEKWTSKVGCDIVKGKDKSDPAAVVFDAITAAKSRGADIVLIDTAGRLHTKNDLMRELEKIARVSSKATTQAPHETLLVLDATIGQNGIQQAQIFHQYTPLTGLILTKMDGSAKGGTAFALCKALDLPIQYIGTGERIEDFTSFNPKDYINSLFA